MGTDFSFLLAALSRGPGERTPSQNMNVEMIDRLAAVFTDVDHHAISLVKAFGARDLSRSPQ